MASVDVPVALLGYGTVGAAVDRLLTENADDIERATGHRLRVVQRARARPGPRARRSRRADGLLTTDFAAIRDDPAIALVAEVMGGIEPARGYVLDLLAAGKPVVTANKQLIAQRGAELFPAASAAGVQLRFEASVCAAIPVIKVLREALVVSNVHRVLGIVNGTTNYILTKMEGGATYEDALAEAQRLGFAEADPTEDVSGADAAAKMAILATIAFGSRVTLADVDYEGIEAIVPGHIRAAREMGMVVRLIGAGHARRRVGRRARAARSRRPPPSAGRGRGRVQRRHARRATRSGRSRSRAPARAASRPPRPSSPTWSRSSGRPARASSRTTPPGGRWRGCRPGSCARPSTSGSRSTTGPACSPTWPSGWRRTSVSVARLVQHQTDDGAALHVVTHEAPTGAVDRRPRRDRGASRDARDADPPGRDLGPERAVSGMPRASSRGVGQALIERYRDRLPVSADTPVVSLGEGSTPLLPAPRLGARLGVELWLKREAGNPTGSFKDRGMTVAVSKALEEGAAAVICASTGNTAASAAAYAARAGIPAVILQPQGAVASGKLAQTRMYGARVLEVRGSFDEALAAARELADAGHARARQLDQPVPPPRPEDGGVRDRRGARRRAGRARPPLRRRREHERLRPGLRRARRRSGPARRRAGRRPRPHRRVGDPDRRPGARTGRRRGGRAHARGES